MYDCTSQGGTLKWLRFVLTIAAVFFNWCILMCHDVMTPPPSTQHPDAMASSISVRSYTTSRQPSFSSRSLMDTSRARSRASVSFLPSSPLSRPASAGPDLNGPMGSQVNSVHGNSANDKEAMQNLNNRLASYLDKVRAGLWWSGPQRVSGGLRSPNSSQYRLSHPGSFSGALQR